MLKSILDILSSPLESTRGRAVVGLLVFTGGVSIVAGAVGGGSAWAFPVQVAMVLIFIVGTAFILTPPEGRTRLLAASAPAVGAVVLGLTLLPQYFLALAGAGVGWFVAALVLFRQQSSPEVHKAIRRMRKGDYETAISEMDTILKRDRENPEHYRLRAMIFQLDQRLDRARRDYQTMLEVAPDGESGDALRAEAYNGLSEVGLQAGRYEEAAEAAEQAHALYPENWVPLYNLGLIHDRLGNPERTVEYLTQANDHTISDARQRLLAHFYLARAHNRLGDVDAAAAQVRALADMWRALEALEKLLGDEQSAPLSSVIADDVRDVRALMIDELEATDL